MFRTMKSTIESLTIGRLAIGVVCFALASMTLAQDNEPVPEPSTESNPPTREQLSALLEKALPAVIVDDNVELLRKLVAPVLEPLSVYETVDPNKSARGAARTRRAARPGMRPGGRPTRRT